MSEQTVSSFNLNSISEYSEFNGTAKKNVVNMLAEHPNSGEHDHFYVHKKCANTPHLMSIQYLNSSSSMVLVNMFANNPILVTWRSYPECMCKST